MKICGAGAWVGFLAVAVVAGGFGTARAADEPRRDAVGKLASPAGSVLQRTADGKSWHAVGAKDDISAGAMLMALPGFRGDIQPRSGAVQLTLWGNLQEFYDFPLLESAAVLNAAGERDLDLTLDRGRILLTNGKGKRPARVQVRFRDVTTRRNHAYELVLSEPGSQMALEMYSRWPAGSPFSRKRSEDNTPTQVLMIYAVKGSADLKIAEDQHLMEAPASFRWDNVDGRQSRPESNVKLPAYVTQGPAGPVAESLKAAVTKLEKELADGPPQKVLEGAVASSDPATRELGVYGVAAIDDLQALIEALANPRHPDVRQTANQALRQWIARDADQDLRLFNYLVRQQKYTEREAETVMHLLHGFTEQDRALPQTYETLIEYLRFKKVPVRELAHWQLYRWVQAGRNIPYDAAGNEAALDKAYKAWKELIPQGQLPPAPKRQPK